MIRRIIALVVKELQEQLRTPRSAAMLFLPVIIQTLILPFAATMDVTHCKAAILNEDAGSLGSELVQRLRAAPCMSETFIVYGREELMALIESRSALIGVHIPSDFSRRAQRGEAADVQVISDGRRANSSQIAAGYAASIVSSMGAEAVEGSGDKTAPVTRHLYNPALDYKWFILPCLIGMLGMLTSFNITAMALAREREEGTYEQLCVTPMSPFEILLGKIIPALVIVTAQAAVIAAISRWGYGLPFTGSLPALFSGVMLYCLALGGVGFALSSFCSTQQQAFVAMFCVILPFILLSGFLAPAENMPIVLQTAARADPLYYMFIIVRGIFLKGFGFAEIAPHLAALAAIALLSLAAAYTALRLRRS